MEAYKWFSFRPYGIVIFTVLILLTGFQPVSAIECFVCSYAPRSNSLRIDGCTETNFTDVVIDTRHCDFGCERVAIYDVNGELESYHRNCAHDDTPLTNTCEDHVTVALTKIVCACDYSYCNGAGSHGSSPHSLLQLAAFSALASSSLWQIVVSRLGLTFLNM